MADQYQYQVTGTGKTVEAALENVESKLPFPLKDPTKYEGYTTLPHEALPDGQGYSVTIAYTLAASAEQQSPQKRGRVQSSDGQPSTVPKGRPRGAGAGTPTRLEQIVGNLHG